MAKPTTTPGLATGPAAEAPRAADSLPTRGGSFTVDPETGALIPTDKKVQTK